MALDETPGTITVPQANYMKDLVAKKDLTGNDRWTPTDEQRAWLEAGNYSGMSKAQASKAIKNLLSLNDQPMEPAVGTVDAGEHGVITAPSTGKPTVGQLGNSNTAEEYTPVPVVNNGARFGQTELDDEVDDGYYFIVDPTNNEERFFHVSKGKQGTRWEGYTFLDVRGGDFLYKVTDVAHKTAVFREILKDPVTAMNEYGIKLGVCGKCGRTLTARDSRLRGIGPICAAQLMMQDAQATDEQLDMLRSLGLKKD